MSDYFAEAGNAVQPTLIARMPSAAALYGRALGSLRKIHRTQSSTAPTLPALAIARAGILLEAARIDRYRHVCGFIPAQGVPLTYPHLLAFPLHLLLMTDARFPWPALGLVHLANTVRQHAPLRPGDALYIAVRIGAPLAHHKGQAFTFHTHVYREDGDRAERVLVWESDSIYLRIGVARPAGMPIDATAGPDGNRSASAELASAAEASGMTSASAASGTSGTSARSDKKLVRIASWQLDAGLGRRYAAVSGDFNPIHLGTLPARIFGFRQALMHGMWTKARALAALSPPQPLQAASASVEFKLPLWLPATASLWRDAEIGSASDRGIGNVSRLSDEERGDNHRAADNSNNGTDGSGLHGSGEPLVFEVRDAAGEKPHLRGRFALNGPLTS